MTGIITTNPARCRDCYRCVRTCTVKAVRIAQGQAEIVPELCIECANCVHACPQNAKVVRDDLPAVRAALAAGRCVVASVAPSAPAFFEMASFDQMEQALARLGFRAAGETAFGAEMVGIAHGEMAEQDPSRQPLITSSCPVIVNLIERYYPDLIHKLAPLVSPMIAHGRYLRQRYGESAFIVFMGPCIAKKGEIVEPGISGIVDAALTFTELQSWMDDEGCSFPQAMAETALAPQRAFARLFPVEGGLVGTAHMDTDMLSSHIVTATGLSACRNVLEGIQSGVVAASLVELMACEGGCINGPALLDRNSVVHARQRVMDYARRRQPVPLPVRDEWPDLGRSYHNYSQPVPSYSEEQIAAVLAQVDKFAPADELNCGACGYESCRDKAAAVLRGMAEATMCIPYMRARAESLTNVVIDVAPTPIVIVDKSLHIQDMSPSAAQMFGVQRAKARGLLLREIISDVDDFRRVRDSNTPILNRVRSLHSDLVVEESIVPVGGENLLVAIIRDITTQTKQHQERERLRSETLHRTQEVINQQMRVAHEIASLLGETTADTKVLLTQLAHLMDESSDEPTG